MRYCLAASLLAALSFGANADAVYQCSINGATVFQGEPCPGDTTVRSMHAEPSPASLPPRKPEPHPDSQWRLAVGSSPIDDSKTVVMSTEASSPVSDKFGRTYTPELYIRCAESVTAMYVNFDGMFMADTGSYGSVTLRVDEQRAFTLSMQESTNNESLGLWRAPDSVRFIHRLRGGEELTIRVTPYSESPVTTTFPISGVDRGLHSIRQTCQW